MFQAPVHQQHRDVGCGVEDGGGAAAGLSLLGWGGVGFGGAGCPGLVEAQAKSFSRVRPDARGGWAGAAQGAGRGRAVGRAAGGEVSIRVVVGERVGAAAGGRGRAGGAERGSAGVGGTAHPRDRASPAGQRLPACGRRAWTPGLGKTAPCPFHPHHQPEPGTRGGIYLPRM